MVKIVELKPDTIDELISCLNRVKDNCSSEVNLSLQNGDKIIFRVSESKESEE